MSQGGPNHDLTREQVEELCGMAVLLFYPDRNLGIHMRWHKEDGYGEKTWPDGDIYKGEFKDSEWSGQGILTFPDGATYKGEWANGFMNGEGTFTWSDGKEKTGTWVNGELQE